MSLYSYSRDYRTNWHPTTTKSSSSSSRRRRRRHIGIRSSSRPSTSLLAAWAFSSFEWSAVFGLAARSLSSSSSSNFSSSGQRYLYVPAADADADDTTSTAKTHAADVPTRAPPLLIIPGTAQSIELWEHHVPSLSQTRTVVICEPIGLGIPPPRFSDEGKFTAVDVSIPRQAEIMHRTLEEIMENHGNDNDDGDDDDSSLWDVAGFSLGGRIAMAMACLEPTKIHRLHLTGVARERSSWGTLQIMAWKDLLQHGSDLRPFAWSALLASYSPEFLMQQKDKLPQWIEGVCQRHTLEGLRRLVHDTHSDNDESDPWSVAAMAEEIRPLGIMGHLCVGRSDRLAPVHEVKALADVLRWPEPTIIERAAHVPPIENPRVWRRDLQEFLNAE